PISSSGCAKQTSMLLTMPAILPAERCPSIPIVDVGSAATYADIIPDHIAAEPVRHSAAQGESAAASCEPWRKAVVACLSADVARVGPMQDHLDLRAAVL